LDDIRALPGGLRMRACERTPSYLRNDSPSAGSTPAVRAGLEGASRRRFPTALPTSR